MISYNEELAQLMKNHFSSPLPLVEQKFDELEQRLIDYQQNADLCHHYLQRLQLYFGHGLLVKAINYLNEKYPFIQTYARKVDLLLINQASIVLINCFGYDNDFFNKSIEIYKQAKRLNIPTLIQNSLNNIGYCHFEMKDYEQAEHYYFECYDYIKQIEAPEKKRIYLTLIMNIVNLYIAKNDFTKAEYYLAEFEQSDVIKKPTNTIELLEAKMKLANARQQSQLAMHYAKQILIAFPKDVEFEYQLLIPIYQYIAQLYELNGELDMAIETLERLNQIIDQLTKNEVYQHTIQSYSSFQQNFLLENIYEDSLTGVSNRLGFEKLLTPILQAKKNVWRLFAIIDLDYFKQINDTHGHLIGDEVLKEISKRANQHELPFMKFPIYFCRYGGDEFLLYYEADSKEHIVEFMQLYYKHLIEEPFIYSTHHFQLSCTLGGIYSQHENLTFEQWLVLADQVLYEVKNAGRGQMKIVERTLNKKNA